jgi:hypothetical protein
MAGLLFAPAGSISFLMMDKLKEVLERARTWPESDQAELAEYAEYAEQIERRHAGDYCATPDELAAIEEADSSGVAAKEEVEAAFRTFRRA